MIFTRRFHLLVGLGILPFLLVWLGGGGLRLATAVLIGYDLLLVALVRIDWQRMAAPGDWPEWPTRSALLVTRHLPPRLMLGVENEVRIAISLPLRHSLTLTLRDEYPPELEWRGPRELVRRTVPDGTGREVAEATYRLFADRRGDFSFGDIVLRWPAPWGLVVRQVRFPAAMIGRVYPNIEAARRQSLAVQPYLANPADQGRRLSSYRGPGREFESLRDYVTGDELRHVAWAATARRGRLTTRQYQVERNQTVMIMIDAGRLMTSRIERLTKFDYAIEAALTLAATATANGDNVGLLVFERQVTRYLPPRKGPLQLSAFLEALYNLQPRLIEPSYPRAFEHLSRHCRKRSLVIILTDLVDRDASADLLAGAMALIPRHLPLIVTIGDRDLRALVKSRPETIDDVYRQSVAEELLQQRELALGRIVEHGGLALDLPAGSLAVELLDQYLEIKARGRL
jgi:uncharacterized protein (DUF58 family)